MKTQLSTFCHYLYLNSELKSLEKVFIYYSHYLHMATNLMLPP
jgi:hypothetical protein